MKDKIKKTWSALLICWLLYILLDWGLNGVMLDWLDNKFVSHQWVRYSPEQDGYFYTSIRWERVKEYLFRAFAVFVLFFVLVARLIVLTYGARREKKVIREAGRMISQYMKHERDVTDVFPPEYAGISDQGQHAAA